MEREDVATYAEETAEVYDAWRHLGTAPVVDRLAELAASAGAARAGRRAWHRNGQSGVVACRPRHRGSRRRRLAGDDRAAAQQASWLGEPFTASSRSHVSVYERVIE
jgi:hypothetical protein